MKHCRFCIILLLCLLLLLCGCQETPVATTAPPTEPPTTAPTEPSPAQLYADAAAVVENSENLLLRVNLEQTIEVSGETYTTDSGQTITYLNYGTDQLHASVREIVTFCDHSVSITELYADGKVYTTLSDTNFITEFTDSDYTQLHTPAVLLDASLYGSVTQEGSVFTFSDPTVLESWVAPESAELIEASGTATVSADGKLTESTYKVVYQYGPSKITETYHVTVGTPTVTAEELPFPSDTTGYITCDGVGAVWLYERAWGFLMNTDKITSQLLESILSQAAGLHLSQQIYLDAYPADSAPMYRVNTSVNQTVNGGSDSYELEEIFRDGMYSSSTDGGEPTEYGVPLASMQNYFYDLLTENIMEMESLADIKCTDTGTLYLLEITGTEELADGIKQELCYKLFQNATLLDQHSTAYKTEKIELYFSIDKYTGTPVALGLLFEGVHTIDGQDFILSQQLDQSFELPSKSAYHTITEENLPEAEPEQKAKPLFYHVTGTNGQEMWLFGTIHIGDERTAYLPQEIYDAFDNSDALAIECDVDGFDEKVENDQLLQTLIATSYYYTGTTIDKHIDTPELYDEAKRLLKATGNYFYNSEYMKAYIWGNSIDNFYLTQGRELTADQGVEKRLTTRAKEKNIPLREVESVIFQIQMSGSYSGELQEFLLYNSVAGNGQENWESSKELFEMWCRGDEAELFEYLNDDDPWELKEEDFDLEGLSEEDLQEVNDIISRLDEINAELTKIEKEYNTAMSIDRNEGMLEVAKDYLESGDVVFYAVGLAHLLADNGLVNALRDAGYTVELVTYA